MYRITKLGSGTYALQVEVLEDDVENIIEFVESGDVVILCNDLQDLTEYDIDPDDIQIVEG